MDNADLAAIGAASGWNDEAGDVDSDAWVGGDGGGGGRSYSAAGGGGGCGGGELDASSESGECEAGVDEGAGSEQEGSQCCPEEVEEGSIVNTAADAAWTTCGISQTVATSAEVASSLASVDADGGADDNEATNDDGDKANDHPLAKKARSNEMLPSQKVAELDEDSESDECGEAGVNEGAGLDSLSSATTPLVMTTVLGEGAIFNSPGPQGDSHSS